MGGLPSFEGITALVTGASSGIGRELAVELAAGGARVGLVARRRQELEAVAAEIRARGGRALAAPCDVAEREAVFAAARAVEEELGAVDLLVNSAGFGGRRSFLRWDPDEVERMFAVNVLGTVHATRAVLPGMVERRRGWVVFLASVAGKVATPGESVYAATKFAVVGLASALSLELEPHGVHVLTVCPGAVRTSFFSEEDLRRLPTVALRHMVEPSQVVRAVLEALRRGRREVVVPRWMAVAPRVQALAPGLFRRQVARTVGEVVEGRDREGEGPGVSG